ncbi:secreted RxLR effector protein 161-like [Rutidosis leptorrhynchoides]|uniref:secreted RxLR effector protein 161-like n=1 Tax=Rutidosis leptorrhynchoides TaxID=125765 RepID=UPI003A99B7FB
MEDERIAKNPLSVNHGITPENTGPKVNPTLYMAIIGSLMYLTASPPDIMFATCLCTHYQAQPNVNHMLAAKKIMRYLKGTPSLGLWYPRKDGFDLTAFCDSDYRGCKRDFKSTSGDCQFLGSRLVSWQCKKQTAVAQSTCEAEYIAAASCTSQVIWIQQQLRDYGTTTQRADLFTKAFDRPHFLFLLNVLGVKDMAEVVSDRELLK